jgi:hypothetical protein
MKTVRIGGASSYAMDSTASVAQLLRAEPSPHYLMFDFMSEGNIGAMAKARAADPAKGGYLTDFVTVHIAPNLHDIASKGVKFLANAGGFNPKACAEAIEALFKEHNVDLKVAYIAGDDLLADIEKIRAAAPKEMFSGAPMPAQLDSINAYLGAFPIARALAEGADIVVTGRCADSSLGLGALVHEFGWKADDWDRLAAGTLVGHLLECGCQLTGGTFTDWEDVPGWEDVGFPIAEISEDGSCVISKPANTGGLISVGTVTEQTFYEVSDPRAYIVPDVVCDFSNLKIEQVGENLVSVSNARGYPATSTYKCVASYNIGWRATYSQVVLGINATAKAKRQGEALIQRGKNLLRGLNIGEFSRTDVDMIGSESQYGPRATANSVREVFMRASVDHVEMSAVQMFLREALASTSAMAPGSTATISGNIAPLSKLFLFLLPKSQVHASVGIGGKIIDVPVNEGQPFDSASLKTPPVPTPAPFAQDAATTVPLIDLAWGRSGEKGNLFNVAVIARKPEYLPYIRAALTADAVGNWFAHLYPADASPKVDIFDMPGPHAINYVVRDSMDGGILVSPRVDHAAKGMAQQLLEFPVTIPKETVLAR